MLTDQVVYVFGVVPACCSEVILVRRSRMPQLLPAYSKLVADGGFRDFQQIMVPVRRIFSVIVCPFFFSICVLFIFQPPPPTVERTSNFQKPTCAKVAGPAYVGHDVTRNPGHLASPSQSFGCWDAH